MSYLPILINLAPSEELQKLKGIGPNRSKRIIKYREEVSDISTPAELVEASGLSPTQVERISKEIDWCPAKKIGSRDAGTVFFTLLSSLVSIIAALSHVKIDDANSAQLLYNLGITLILLSAVSNLIDLASKRVIPTWSILAIVLLTIGIFIFSILIMLPSTYLTNAIDAASIRGLLTLLIFLNLIFYLTNGPSFYLRYQVWRGINIQSLINAQRLHQYAYFFLSLISVYVIIFLDSSLWFEELFALWIASTLILSTSSMLKGDSPFRLALSMNEARLYSLLERNLSSELSSTEHRRLSVLGRIYMITGILVLAITAIKVVMF